MLKIRHTLIRANSYATENDIKRTELPVLMYTESIRVIFNI